MAGVIKCPHCNTRIIPKSDDTCPNCRKLVTEANQVAVSVPVTRPPQPVPATPASPRAKPPPAHRPFTTRAWDLTRQHRTLWVFGFLAGLSFGGAGISFGYIQGGAWFLQNAITLFNVQTSLGVVALIIALIFWLAGGLARIALIRNVAALVSNGNSLEADIPSLLRYSVSKLPKIILMQVFVWLPYIALQMASYYLATPSYGIIQNVPPITEQPTPPTVVTWSLFVLTILTTLTASLLDAFSYRILVLEDLKLVASLKKAADVVRTHPRTVWSLATYLYPIGSMAALVGVFIVFPLLFSILQKIFVPASECVWGFNELARFTECAAEIRHDSAILISFVLINIGLAALTSVPAAFQSTTMTLAHLQLSPQESSASDQPS